MSIEAMAWALSVPLGGSIKLVLIGLANHAHADGTEARPAIDTLMTYACCDRRTVQRSLRQLEDEGWIALVEPGGKNGKSYGGTNVYSLVYGRQNAAPKAKTGGRQNAAPKILGAANRTSRGGKSDILGAAPTPPEPSLEPTTNRPTTTATAPARDDELELVLLDEPVPTVPAARERIPDGFPDELRPHARAVMAILKAIAVDHQAKAVNAKSLGLTLMARPRKPLVKVALDFAAWAADAPRPVKDVVATYRNWLDREPDLATTEVLDAGGVPMGRPPGRSPGMIRDQPISRAQRQENERFEMLRRKHDEALAKEEENA